MTIKPLVLVLFPCFFGLCCATKKPAGAVVHVLSATSLKPFGRTAINEQQQLELISSAAQVGFSFEGPECTVMASVPAWLSHNYLQYELDGVYQKRLRISSKTAAPVVIKAGTGGRHTVWLYKATEARTGPVFLHQISGTNLHAVERPEAPLIEFIGNSITCGAAADPSEVPCGSGVYHDHHNAYLAYGPRVARAVGANFLLSSVSGIGLYRNWNSDGPAMPQVYEKTDFGETSMPLWDFGRYSPAVVSIALGTNDLSRGDGKKPRAAFDSAAFVNAAVLFVAQVKQKYPKAKIVLLSSPMTNGEARERLQNCLSAVKAVVDQRYLREAPVGLFFFRPLQAKGCTGHPNVEDHALMADQLLLFFKTVLN